MDRETVAREVNYDPREEDYTDDERNRDSDDYSGRQEAPMFGCACQEALIVDETCLGCCIEMARRHAEALREELAAVEASIREMESGL